MVVTAVPECAVRAAPRPAVLAAHGRDCLEQWDELGDVVAVAVGQGERERDARGIGDQMTRAACLTPVNGAWSRGGAPF